MNYLAWYHMLGLKGQVLKLSGSHQGHGKNEEQVKSPFIISLSPPPKVTILTEKHFMGSYYGVISILAEDSQALKAWEDPKKAFK